MAARAGASKMGFYKNTLPGQVGSLAVLSEEKDDGEGEGDFIEEFEPAHMGVLPYGYEFQGFDPKYPNENYDPFIKANLRDIAVGWGVSYHALTGDLKPHVPAGQLGAILGISVVLALLALSIPTRRALRTPPIKAVGSAE